MFTKTIIALIFSSLALAVGANAAAPPPRPLAEKCSGTLPGAKPFWLTAEDGVRLYAAEAGSGDVAVVLAHESGADLCSWFPYARTLLAAGLRVIAFDFRGFGDSESPGPVKQFLAYDRDFRAAIEHARSTGAKYVFLVGASLGGAAALTYAPVLKLDGVVSLSGELRLDGRGLDAGKAIRRLRAPLLIVGSRHDRYLSIPDALTLLRRAGSKDKRTAFYPGGFHGIAIVDSAPYAPRARALVLAWMRARAA